MIFAAPPAYRKGGCFIFRYTKAMSHTSQLELLANLEKAKSQVSLGGTYQHYKGSKYTLTDLAFLEANMELCVIYHPLHNPHLNFIRPLSIWLEKVEYEGKTIPRFALLNE